MPRIFLPKARGTKRTSFLLISPHLCVKCSTLFPDKKIIHFFFQRATTHLFFYYYSDLDSFQKPVPLSATPKHIPSHRSIPTFPSGHLLPHGTACAHSFMNIFSSGVTLSKKMPARYYRESKRIVILHKIHFLHQYGSCSQNQERARHSAARRSGPGNIPIDRQSAIRHYPRRFYRSDPQSGRKTGRPRFGWFSGHARQDAY